MVVTAPAGAERTVVFQAVIHYLQRFGDQWVVSPANAVTDEFQKARIHNFSGIEIRHLPRFAIRHMDKSGCKQGIVERFARCRRTNPHVMTLDAGQQKSIIGSRPLVQMRLNPVGVAFQKARQFGRLVGSRNVRRAHQRGDHRGQCTGRVARILFPPFLLGHRRVSHQERCRALNKRKHIKDSQPIQLPQTPRQDDRERNLVQLNARPVSRAVDPEILREASVRPLRAGQINQRPACGFSAPTGQQRGRGLHHVARPHKVIPAQVIVALGRAPRDRSRRNKRAGVGLVLMRQDDVVADPHESSLIG